MQTEYGIMIYTSIPLYKKNHLHKVYDFYKGVPHSFLKWEKESFKQEMENFLQFPAIDKNLIFYKMFSFIANNTKDIVKTRNGISKQEKIFQT